jgi:hypothetical protein
MVALPNSISSIFTRDTVRCRPSIRMLGTGGFPTSPE